MPAAELALPASAALPAGADPVAALFERLGDELFGTAYQFLGDRDDAAEAYQEAFLKCWRRRDRMAEVRDAKRWIFQVLANTARDLRRRRRVRRAVLPLEREPAASTPAGDALEQEELVTRARDAIRALPEAEREVFALRQNGGLAYGDIASTLGIPEGTVKTRMRRALARLREVLDRAARGPADRGHER